MDEEVIVPVDEDEERPELSTNLFEVMSFDDTQFEEDDQVEFELSETVSLCYSLKIKRLIYYYIDKEKEEPVEHITMHGIDYLSTIDKLQLYDVELDHETLKFIEGELLRIEAEYEKNKTKE